MNPPREESHPNPLKLELLLIYRTGCSRKQGGPFPWDKFSKAIQGKMIENRMPDHSVSGEY